MLPVAHRLTDGETFRLAVRRGSRAGASTMVVHLSADLGDPPAPVQVGFVVSRAVGNAVARNRVKRRLRHLTREHLPMLQGLSGRRALVVRALPAAAGASSAQLHEDLGRCLARVTT